MINMSANDGIVNLWELPENEVCVRFSSRLQKLMIKKALEKTKGRYFLAKEINVKPCTIYGFEKSRFGSVTLSFVKRLSDFLVKNGYKEFSLSSYKRKKLENLLSSYKSPPRLRRGKSCEKVLEICKQLKSEGKRITNKNIANKLKKNYRYINELTLKLVKEGKFMILKNGNIVERELW